MLEMPRNSLVPLVPPIAENALKYDGKYRPFSPETVGLDNDHTPVKIEEVNVIWKVNLRKP